MDSGTDCKLNAIYEQEVEIFMNYSMKRIYSSYRDGIWYCFSLAVRMINALNS